MNDQLSEVFWGSMDEAIRRTTLSRGQLYNFIRDGLIRSRVVRRKNARGSGHRLIDLNSLFEFIENSPSEAPDEIRARNRAAALAMTKAKKTQGRQHAGDSKRAAARQLQREKKAA
jgi:hypothetical protein